MIFSIFFVLFLVISLIFTYFIKIVNPIIVEFGTAETERMLINSSNLAVQVVLEEYNYDDIFSINYDKDGSITSINANQVKINELSNSLALKAQENIDNKNNISANIPIGTCSGIGFLAGRGAPIELYLNPIGNISCEIKTEFLEAGINQTIHKLILNVKGKISLVLPFTTKKINSEIQVLISECLIVGKIPNAYLGFSNIKDFFS